MVITLDDLTVNFRHLDRNELLADWRWLIGTEKVPILLTAIGDAFVQDSTDGSIHLLDVAAGQLKAVAETMDAFHALLSDKQFVSDYFAVEMIHDLKVQGRTLKPGQVFSLKIPLVLGGKCALWNVEPADIEVHYSLAGQIHQKVSNLEPGRLIGKITISDE
jgi:hypothetical protein